MLETKFNLIEKLQFITSSKSEKNSSGKDKFSFDHGDIPGMFRHMYETANYLAAKEGLLWGQIKWKQDTLDKMSQGEQNEGTEEKLLETQLWEYVNKRREEFMVSMIQLLELYAKSKWSHSEQPKNQKS
jgi:hypothetical protein